MPQKERHRFEQKPQVCAPKSDQKKGDAVRIYSGDSSAGDATKLGKKASPQTLWVVPAIDRRYPLSEVPEALRYLAGGHPLGKLVITVADNNQT